MNDRAPKTQHGGRQFDDVSVLRGAHAVTDKFCIMPWKHLTVNSEGSYRLCCVARNVMTDGGAPMSVYHHSLEHAWNSDYMRDVRRAMLAGKDVPDCQTCYNNEASSGTSYRVEVAAGMMDRSVEQLRAESEANDYRVDVDPKFLKLELGKLCNLECRMCGAHNSSQIERDEVHSRWAPVWGFDGVPMVAWSNDAAVIGPHPCVGVRSEGFSVPEVIDGVKFCWSGNRASLALELDENTALDRLEIGLNTICQHGQIVTVAVNGKTQAERLATPQGSRMVLDLTGEKIRGGLRIEIHSRSTSSNSTEDHKGVAVEEISLFRQPAKGAQPPNHMVFTRLPGKTLWEDEDAFIFGEALRNAPNLDRLYITGGEPFLIKKVEEIVDYLVESRNTHMTVEFSTNCTRLNTDVLRKLNMFKAVNINLSLDGVGDVHEYIRNPIKWPVVDRNIRMMKRLLRASITITPVIHIYNALNIVDLCRYADDLGIDIALYNVLHFPDRLRVSVMPAPALALAAERLRAYAKDGCRPGLRGEVLSLAQYFESLPGNPSMEMFRTFMLFTNDLDTSRHQSFERVHHELYRAFRVAGYSWTEETLYAHAGPGAPRTRRRAAVPKEEQASV
jgi:MoaA/NifB/PqqE/SkfB family radical SAM enzyme